MGDVIYEWPQTNFLENRIESKYFFVNFVFSLKRVTLELTVCDYDRIGTSDPIGKVSLGYNRKGAELKHWKEMVENPRRPVIHWHVLKVKKKNNEKRRKKTQNKWHFYTYLNKLNMNFGANFAPFSFYQHEM